MSRVGLQLVLAASALVAIVTGAWGLKEGVLDPAWGLGTLDVTPALVLFDTTFRFYDGVWFGLGVVFLALIPGVERRAEALRVVVTLVFLGGVGRLVSILQVGLPHPALIVATIAELLYPLLLLWQRSVALAVANRAAGGAGQGAPTPAA